MAGSTLSRRLSEVVGVALFALSLLWLIALVSYSPSDPVWFFNTGSDLPPANFAGRVGAFLAELSFQLVGYAAYLAPVIVAVDRLALFLVQRPRCALHQGLRRGAALRLHRGVPVAGVRRAGHLPARSSAPAATSARRWRACSSDYLNRTGSIILILTLLFLALILSTQFSFGRLFAAIGSMIVDQWAALLGAHPRPPRREAAREAAPGGAEEASRQTAGEGRRRQPAGPIDDTALVAVAARAANAKPRPASREPPPEEPPTKASRTAAMVGAAAAALKAASSKPTPPPAIKKLPVPTPAPLPLPEPEKAAGRAQEGGATRSRRWRCSTPRRPSARSTSAS